MLSISTKLALQHLHRVKKERLDRPISKGDTKGAVSLFHHLLDSDMPASELSDERLAKEAQVMLGAGTATTARTIGYISYYILAKPQIRSRLQEELKEVMANYPERIPSLAELERLPYFQALIKEGLR